MPLSFARRRNSRFNKHFLKSVAPGVVVLVLVLMSFFLNFYMLDKELIALSPASSSQAQEVHIPIVRGRCPCFSKSDIDHDISLIEAGTYDLNRSASCRRRRNHTPNEDARTRTSLDEEHNQNAIVVITLNNRGKTQWAYSRRENTCQSHGYYKQDFKEGSVQDFIDCQMIIDDACARISCANMEFQRKDHRRHPIRQISLTPQEKLFTLYIILR